MTSFSSLWQVKNALSTKKTGHTGTLDNFADGLLVALTDRLTRLVPYITACDKEYLARIAFGAETDTLDPEGAVCREADFPLYAGILSSLPSFIGSIMQTPPVYSAVHVDGKRSSDRVRMGEPVVLPPRPITIHTIEPLSAMTVDGKQIGPGSIIDPTTRITTMDIRVHCSKGTYIRSLARDIALAALSAAHLGALRRTRIGPFNLEDAAGRSLLDEFGVHHRVRGMDGIPRVPQGEILSSIREFTPDIAASVGLDRVSIDPGALKRFYDGQPPSESWFSGMEDGAGRDNAGKMAVFCDGLFCGIILSDGKRISYEFVYRRDT